VELRFQSHTYKTMDLKDMDEEVLRLTKKLDIQKLKEQLKE